MEFILFNGKILSFSTFNPSGSWRDPGLYISTEMWFANGTILFFNEHYLEIESLLRDLGRTFTPDFPSQQELYRLLTRLINKNKAFMGGWLALKIRFSEVKTDIFADVLPCSQRSIPFIEAGKMAVLSPYIKFSGNSFNKYPFFSEYYWVAETFRLSGSRNELSVFINQRGMVTEALNANLYAVFKNIVYTPAPTSGCFIDKLREKVLLSAEFNGFQIQESENLTWAALLDMEEVFTVSEKEGFKWIMGIDTRRFIKTKTELIWRRLNKILENSQTRIN
jgi:hypothetical protein